MAIDLHVHSVCSDGTVPPRELPELARIAGLSAIALTDHDTTDGIREFLSCQEKYPEIELIAGVELSSRLGAKEIHIVGLFIDPENDYLQDFMYKMRQDRIIRAKAMQSKLASLGYEVTDEDLAAVGMQQIGRAHV